MITGIYQTPVSREDEPAYQERCAAYVAHNDANQIYRAAVLAQRKARRAFKTADKRATAAREKFAATPSGQLEAAEAIRCAVEREKERNSAA